MQINGPTHVHGPQVINSPHRTQGTDQAAPSNHFQGVDQLDISQEADQVIQFREASRAVAQDIQASRAQRIEQLIREGRFDLESSSPIGLPKVRVLQAKKRGKKKKEEKASE